MSFDILVSHRHESSAASTDLKLFLYSPIYMSFLSVGEHGALNHIYELSTAAGLVAMKVNSLLHYLE